MNGDGMRTQYWHLVVAVRPGQHVVALPDGARARAQGYEHVHFAQVERGQKGQPAHGRPPRAVFGHHRAARRLDLVPLGTSEQGALPRALRHRDAGRAFDTPALRVPGKWRNLPVAPALITWQIVRLSNGRTAPASGSPSTSAGRSRPTGSSGATTRAARGAEHVLLRDPARVARARHVPLQARCRPRSTRAGSATGSSSSSSPLSTRAATAAPRRRCSSSGTGQGRDGRRPNGSITSADYDSRPMRRLAFLVVALAVAPPAAAADLTVAPRDFSPTASCGSRRRCRRPRTSVFSPDADGPACSAGSSSRSAAASSTSAGTAGWEAADLGRTCRIRLVDGLRVLATSPLRIDQTPARL